MSSGVPARLTRFAEAAAAYAAWCRAEPAAEARADARDALAHLARLVQLALRLELPAVDGDAEYAGTDEAEWRRVYERVGALPVGMYGECLDPLEVPPGETGLGDLADDLADIDRDLVRGLAAWRAGDHAAAEWEWRFHFQVHWGRHATAAMHALHCWLGHADGW